MLLDLPRTRGGWRCVVADPAWSFRDRGSRIAPDADVARPRRGAPGRIYSTMPLVEIASMPVAEIVAPSAHLYLWCPSALLAEGLVVLRAWGFVLKTTIVWDKVTRGGRPAFGAGHYYRGAHELVLFGVRGRCPALVRNQRTRFEGVVGSHSAKPEELQDMAERVSPGPRLELFARRRRAGWACWGNQLPAELAATGTEG
jgi:N6-adenosine-specific RNA methylase IME4